MDYLGLLSSENGRWFGSLPDLGVRTSGKTEEDTVHRLEIAAGDALTELLAEGQIPPRPRFLTKEDFDENDFPLQGEAAVHWIIPRMPNPVSLSIKQAIERSGKTATEIARLMGTSSAAITRMTDPDYDSHSLLSLRKLAQVLNVPLLRFVALRELTFDEFVPVGQSGMYAPGYVALKRTEQLEQLHLPALVQWEGRLFWLDAPAQPPAFTSDQAYLRFEGARMGNEGFTVVSLS